MMTKQEVKECLGELYIRADFGEEYCGEIDERIDEALDLVFKAIDAYDGIPREEQNNE